ncbi:glycosyltransferase [Pseudomonas sp. dw_358]|uniref:glycosyltransferase n=1 Tax=Pseudomonas sp. dw_358 TaxID=2720083 RepID=UPI001BD460D7|nr:glycosyltransferase [Pseudomonas sp. dw_358]
MTRFHIVTINRNNLAGLIKTHVSVQAQTYRNFRWLVVDGNSTDGAVEWLSGLDNDYTDWKSERDRSLYDAMNKGLVKAAAEPGYTLFLNSGDTFHDATVLEKVAEAIAAAPGKPEYVYGDYCLSNSKGQLREVKAKPFERLKLGMISSHQAMYFENDRLNQIRFREDFPLSADYCMIVEFVSAVNPDTGVLKIPQILCDFDTTGVSQVRRFDALKEDLLIRKRYMNLSSLHATGLYVLHYLHTHSKLLRGQMGS